MEAVAAGDEVAFESFGFARGPFDIGVLETNFRLRGRIVDAGRMIVKASRVEIVNADRFGLEKYFSAGSDARFN